MVGAGGFRRGRVAPTAKGWGCSKLWIDFFRTGETPGVGESPTTTLLRTGPIVTQGFFSENQSFWREQADLVPAASCRPEKMIALSDAYGPQRGISDKPPKRQQEIG
jgi:hypothetical protein